MNGPLAPRRAWQARLAERVAEETTRGLKGIFRYRSHKEANADAERWRAEAMTRRAREESFPRKLRRLFFTLLGRLVLRP